MRRDGRYQTGRQTFRIAINLPSFGGVDGEPERKKAMLPTALLYIKDAAPRVRVPAGSKPTNIVMYSTV